MLENLKIIGKTGDDKIANVWLAETKDKKYIEFVESIQPPLPREEKWVLIVSTLFGCPVGCPICDAGGSYKGKLSKEEILAQIDFMVSQRFPDNNIHCKKFKIQFARMGEPSLNPAVLDVLEELHSRYNAPMILPSLSTVAPETANSFFEKLLIIKNKYFSNGNFQLQFSIHTTDQKQRDKLIPIKKWDFIKIAEYGKRFRGENDKKITLNFALAKENPFSVETLKQYFSPKTFIIKITPVNPTINAANNKVTSYFTAGNNHEDERNLINQLRDANYEVILSIGELEENKIGSNCGQFVENFLKNGKLTNTTAMYTYKIKE